MTKRSREPEFTRDELKLIKEIIEDFEGNYNNLTKIGTQKTEVAIANVTQFIQKKLNPLVKISLVRQIKIFIYQCRLDKHNSIPSISDIISPVFLDNKDLVDIFVCGAAIDCAKEKLNLIKVKYSHIIQLLYDGNFQEITKFITPEEPLQHRTGNPRPTNNYSLTHTTSTSYNGIATSLLPPPPPVQSLFMPSEKWNEATLFKESYNSQFVNNSITKYQLINVLHKRLGSNRVIYKKILFLELRSLKIL
jgi:hypothetical protein